MPTVNKLRQVDKLLGNVSVKYSNSEYIADRMFPMVSVKRTVDKYLVYDRDFKMPETNRADKAKAREWTFDLSSNSYSLEKHALKDYISQDDKDNYDEADLRADTVEHLTDKLLLRKELSAAALFTTTNWSLNTSLAAANAWNANTTVSNPIPVWDTATSVILQESGKKANFAMIPEQSLKDVKNHVSVLDRIKYTSSMVSEEMIKGLMGVQDLFVGMASQDTAAEGLTDSISPVWSDFCFFGFKPGSAGRRIPSFGYRFEKNIPTVRRWLDEEREDAEAIEVSRQYQFKVVASLSGYMIKDIRV